MGFRSPGYKVLMARPYSTRFAALFFLMSFLSQGCEGFAASPGGTCMVKSRITAKTTGFDTLVPPGHPFANAVVVKGKLRTYSFPPGATLSRAAGHLVVRGYDGIFIFASSQVQVRHLSIAQPLEIDSLPEERNSAILKSALSSPSRRERPHDDICPDCIVPVVIHP